MSSLRNESGAALVFTLMVVTILLLFIMTLFYQIVNTTKQVSKMEKEIVSEQIANMGVDYFRNYTESFIPETVNSPEEIVDMNFEREILIYLDDERDYWFEIDSQSPQEVSDNEVHIEFTSTGWAHGEEEVVKSSITIRIESEE